MTSVRGHGSSLPRITRRASLETGLPSLCQTGNPPSRTDVRDASPKASNVRKTRVVGATISLLK